MMFGARSSRRRLPVGTIGWLLQGALLAGFALAACGVGSPQYSEARGGPAFEGTGTDTGTDGTGGGFIGVATPQVDTTPVVLAPTPPPPLSGGTLLLASDGVTLVAADPDRDTLWWSNWGTSSLQSVAFTAGDEPGRVVQDGAGLIHVVLRRGGTIATVDLTSGLIVRQTPVCPAPRGVAYDSTQDAVIVACVGGELVTLSAKDDTVLRSLVLDTDLRDPVVLASGYVAVSKLRNAEVLLVDPTGAIASRTRPVFDPSIDATSAWRMVGVEGGTTVTVSHQLATTGVVDVATPNAYGAGSSGGTGGAVSSPIPDLFGQLHGIVTSAVTTFAFDLTKPTASATIKSAQTLPGSLPVDIAVDATGAYVSVQYGNSEISLSNGALSSSSGPLQNVTSIVLDATGRSYVFSREPASFSVMDPDGNLLAQLLIPTPSVADTGHDLFHRSPQGGLSLACASCHPEGRDDARVWNLAPDGLRRTPSLVGGLAATAPFHWTGSLADIDAVMGEVFTKRMGGDIEDSSHAAAVQRFLNAIPRVPVSPVPASAAASYAHGQALFESTTLGCTSCHSGAHLTNNATVDVGTGQAFQVPTLIGVGLRAPFLHDGCAPTLADRFGSCGGGAQHGNTAQLSAGDIADLVTYLQTL